VEIEEQLPRKKIPVKEESAVPVPAQWKFLGDHQKNVLLLVRYPDAVHIPDQQLSFITSVLGACKLGLADVAILNLAHAPSAIYKDVVEQFRSRVILMFDITPEGFSLPVHFPEFQVQPFNNIHFLHTPSLESMEADKILKSKLWVSLRRIFEV
jgi:hypothetical protein